MTIEQRKSVLPFIFFFEGQSGWISHTAISFTNVKFLEILPDKEVTGGHLVQNVIVK